MSTPFLSGVRVLDVTCALAGPYCTTILSDLGADVVKVEPVRGDAMRQRRIGAKKQPIPFDMIHRDKSSIGIDLKAAEGKELLRRLATRSDILVENFRSGAMDGLGLGYEDLKAECPDLVYVSISGFGQFGPMKDAKGIDLVAQAYGGLMSVTGLDDGTIAKPGFPLADLGSGMWAAIGALAALQRVRAGGGGALIDVALSDTIASWSMWEMADYVATNEVPGPIGTAHRLVAPSQAFTCSDGRPLVVGAVERHWLLLCELLDIDLAHDERFATEYLRFQNRAALTDILQRRYGKQPRDYWIATMRDKGIPCGPVSSIAEVLHDEQFGARQMFLTDEARYGTPIIVNTPIVSDGAPRARGRAPGLGNDTARLLEGVGYADDELIQLAAKGIIALPQNDDISEQVPDARPSI